MSRVSQAKALRWNPDDANQWRLSVSREVGQLDFSDFAASASLEGGTVSAGLTDGGRFAVHAELPASSGETP